MPKKVIFIIPSKGFRDEEYFIPKEILAQKGLGIETASDKKGIARGIDGGEVSIKIDVKDVREKNFDALVFVGGPDCLDCLDNENSYNLLREAHSKGKIIGAICISSVILARSGILKNKKATVWSSNLNREPVKTIKKEGVIFTDKSVVVDGGIITADGPDAAREFAETLAGFLKT